MRLCNFNYELPRELIAQKPLIRRENSRLMILNKNEIKHKRFYNIINYLDEGDVLVVNESRVLPYKFVGKKETGGKVVVIINKKIEDCYECIIKGHKIKKNNKLIFNNKPENKRNVLEAQVIDRKNDKFYLRFNKKINSNLINKIGRLPLPFYLKNNNISEEKYQTVFSKKSGSLAAPTAGLHFSKELLERIKKKRVKIARVCLHISFSTFLPIKENDYRKHQMEPEFFSINKKTANIINNRKGRLFVCGTTSLKTLESAVDENGKIKACSGYSNLFIYPGYKFKNKINGLITNFHLPKSSLLLLVCAFYGRKKILNAYEIAIKRKYRFYSFGDAMLLIK
jgi:S-adenosylmethionine:tRNA ribosyltransferase-isomerase